MRLMKAIVATKYGSPGVLQLKDVERPAPGDSEVLIKIYATTVTAGDCELRGLKFPVLFRLLTRFYTAVRKPGGVIMGQELAGEIEVIGDKVTKFKKGDRVFAATLMRLGAYAQYVCLPETYPIALIPANLNFGEATTIPTGGINALHFLRKSNTRSGEKVLINGAGGSIGTYCVQIAKSFGAEVTCVDKAKKLEMLRAIGADHVIDREYEDFTSTGKTYDVIIDVVGKSSFTRSIKCLNPNGRYVLGNLSIGRIIRGLWTTATTDKKVIFELAGYKAEEMDFLKKLLEDGKIKPVIDRQYSLKQIPDAHYYVEAGHKAGNVVITVEH